ncbi:MAG: helix-turn-helix transcriptional regulator [Caulobacter sp.]|nr:helix-turn-helix transcriptional regulator [Caulobacter sp.]
MEEQHDPLAIGRLTPRERECLRLVAEHLHSKEIARRLRISQHTVDGHLNEARRRLGVASRRDAARLLRDWESGHDPLNDLGGAAAGIVVLPDDPSALT